MRAVFLTTLFAAAITSARGMPCGNPCVERPARTYDALTDAGTLETDGGPHGACASICQDPSVDTCSILERDDAGVATVECHAPGERLCSAGGRPTRGVVVAPLAPTSPVADYLAASSALEASSVDAFRRLRRELARHGAPRALLRAASRAARDERRHARAMTSLARRRGAPRTKPHVVEPLAARTLEEIAIENAVEGCVFETFGALVARWQSENALDRDARGQLRKIARDEARHAALAWTFASWVEPRLGREARARLRDARASAVRDLRATLAAPHVELVRERLLPGPAEALALFAHVWPALARDAHG